MKKILFVLVLILSIFCTAQAGYLIRSIITGIVEPADLQNYTLTFDRNGDPVSAASMFDSGTGHSIVIVQANHTRAYVFPVFIDNEYLPIKVRDFHYLQSDRYILCGSRGTGASARAFVAVMAVDFSSMQFIEYQEANIFYSVWADFNPLLPYHFSNFFTVREWQSV